VNGPLADDPFTSPGNLELAVRRVLIANRGEIAVRVARACRDAGLTSIAVYADPDRDAVHVRIADEAYALGGDSPATSYLDIGKVLRAAAASGADAVHPGYGFLSENAEFAQTVLDSGLTWIGPPPHAIRALGDKVAARHIARSVGARLVAGTHEPASGADEVVGFARAHGLPIAIKAAFGGGGRGMRVARTMAEVPEQFASAEREAMAAFGRRECFVERYLDRPRHVETQCLADTHGNVVVVSTRDCSLQRRHQKLVEEAPAPFLTGEQTAELQAREPAAVTGVAAPVLRIGQDGLDMERVAAAVVVLLARMRAGQAAAGNRDPAREQRLLGALPLFLPPRSWQVPSWTIHH
jgi:acetyl-CoA/propionyl-CoA carboxylase, biotin carboxylase, biotin carboxyl carrier protein